MTLIDSSIYFGLMRFSVINNSLMLFAVGGLLTPAGNICTVANCVCTASTINDSIVFYSSDTFSYFTSSFELA